MSELKPCPFCGESKLLYSGGCGFRYDDDDNQIRLFRVHCRTCKGRTGLFESLDEAVEAWNRRTNSTTIQPSALGTNLAEAGTDCISREAVIEVIENYPHGDWNIETMSDMVERIKQLPTADVGTNLASLGTDCISRQAALVAVKDALIAWSYMPEWRDEKILEAISELPPAEPETAKRIVGKSRDGMTLWYQCDMCNEPVDVQDNYCRGCGRRLIDE